MWPLNNIANTVIKVPPKSKAFTNSELMKIKRYPVSTSWLWMYTMLMRLIIYLCRLLLSLKQVIWPLNIANIVIIVPPKLKAFTNSELRKIK